MSFEMGVIGQMLYDLTWSNVAVPPIHDNYVRLMSYLLR